MEWSAGFTAIAPMDRLFCWVKTGFQRAPPSVDRHTPPSAAPANTALPFTASAAIRPLTSPAPPPELDQNGSREPRATELEGWWGTSCQRPLEWASLRAAAVGPAS